MLVTDHHLAGAELPAANVIVNPNVPGAQFASRSLAGVGVAFYVMAALHRALAEPSLPSPATWLDLVALGTVADIVPLDANNRILVAQGLARALPHAQGRGAAAGPHQRCDERGWQRRPLA